MGDQAWPNSDPTVKPGVPPLGERQEANRPGALPEGFDNRPALKSGTGYYMYPGLLPEMQGSYEIMNAQSKYWHDITEFIGTSHTQRRFIVLEKTINTVPISRIMRQQASETFEIVMEEEHNNAKDKCYTYISNALTPFAESGGAGCMWVLRSENFERNFLSWYNTKYKGQRDALQRCYIYWWLWDPRYCDHVPNLHTGQWDRVYQPHSIQWNCPWTSFDKVGRPPAYLVSNQGTRHEKNREKISAPLVRMQNQEVVWSETMLNAKKERVFELYQKPADEQGVAPPPEVWFSQELQLDPLCLMSAATVGRTIMQCEGETDGGAIRQAIDGPPADAEADEDAGWPLGLLNKTFEPWDFAKQTILFVVLFMIIGLIARHI